MNQKIALVVYPEFSFQEIGNLSSLFRWGFDTRTVVVSGDKNPVRSEEGFAILPDITYEEFCVEEYDCLILPGCSDIRQSIRDEKLMEFLRGLEGNETFPIGAICAGPIYLAKAGLLKDKKFTNSMYLEMNERLPFIDMENIRYQPVVEDGNVSTGRCLSVVRSCNGKKSRISVLRSCLFWCWRGVERGRLCASPFRCRVEGV